MYFGTFKSELIVNASNIIGWRTKRRIVVIESDDWGSIRTKNKEAYQAMLNAGLNVDKLHYNSVDCLESNEDLERLFDLLLEFKDSTRRPPVITPMCIMANPDFKAIKDSGFQKYFYEPLDKTLQNYPNHDQVIQLWQKGIKERLFLPGLHGREHLNVNRYLEILQKGNEGMQTAFSNQSVGATKHNGVSFPNYLGAFNPNTKDEVISYNKIIEDAAFLFNKYCGYNPSCFIAPNKEEPRELENVLHKVGVKYMTRSKRRAYPIGDGTFKKEFNWLGKKNSLGQISIVRNCFFEPTSVGEYGPNTDWVSNCMKEIEIAFRWDKPAVISTHRVNFIGSLDAKSRDLGFLKTRTLFTEILKKWPSTEFMTSHELGDLISTNKEV
jgi:hypothetical protein